MGHVTRERNNTTSRWRQCPCQALEISASTFKSSHRIGHNFRSFFWQRRVCAGACAIRIVQSNCEGQRGLIRMERQKPLRLGQVFDHKRVMDLRPCGWVKNLIVVLQRVQCFRI